MDKNILSFHYQDRGSNLLEIFIPRSYENFNHRSIVLQARFFRKGDQLTDLQISYLILHYKLRTGFYGNHCIHITVFNQDTPTIRNNEYFFPMRGNKPIMNGHRVLIKFSNKI